METSTEKTNASQTPSSLEVVEAFIAALEQLDLHAISALVAPNIRYQNFPLPPTKNARQFKRQMRGFIRVLFRFEVQMRAIEERGDGSVFTDRIDIAEGHGFFMNLPVRGTFRVDNGLITEWTDRFSWPMFGLELAKSAPSIIGSALNRIRH